MPAPSVASTRAVGSSSQTRLPARSKAAASPVAKRAPNSVSEQRFSIRIGTSGYEPSLITASAKNATSLVVGKGEGCAAGFLIGSLGIDKDNSSGPVAVKLGRLKVGTYRFTCGMGMVTGELVVR